MYTLSEILKGRPNTRQHDDIRIIRSFIEYKSGADKMDYLIIEMEMMDRDGTPVHLFKAVKFYRIIKLPDTLKQSTTMMDVHAEILSAFWESQINLISMIARIEDCGTDTPIGLMQLFGVQGVAKTIAEAKEIADSDFTGLASTFQGSYRTLEFRVLNSKEAEWMREKMVNMKHIQVVRGIPKARKSAADRSAKGMGGMDTQPGSEETSEQFAIGLSDHEFIALTLTSPIEYDILENWLTQTTRKQTYWASIMQGSTSMNAGISLPVMFAANLGSSMGSSEGVSDSVSEGTSTSISETESISESVSHSQGVSRGLSIGSSESYGESAGISHSEGDSVGTSVGRSEGTSYGESDSKSLSSSSSQGTSQSFGSSNSVGSSQSTSNSFSNSLSQSSSQGESQGTGVSAGQSMNHGVNAGESSGNALGGSLGVPGIGGVNANHSEGISSGVSDGAGQSLGTSVSEGTSQSDSIGESNGKSSGQSNGVSQSLGTSKSQGASQSFGTSVGQSSGRSQGASASDSVSNTQSKSVSDGFSEGISYGKGRSQTESETVSDSISKSTGISKGVSRGTGESWGRSMGTSSAVNNSLSQGLSSSMGIGASVGIGKSYQFIDKEIENIVELLEAQKMRLKKAINGGSGAFFVDMYIATETKKAKEAAKTVAKAAWYDVNAMISPLQILEVVDEEADHLLYHFNAFSACTVRETDKYGQLESYKYSTILNADELTAYTHLLRVSDGGIYADIQNIPELSVPSEMRGDIYVGKILSGYKYTEENGYKTKFDYRVSEETLMHGLFCGGSRSGKTVTALRFVAELANKVRRSETGKRLRIVVMDPKFDWRKLAKYVEPERFRIYSMGDPDVFPFKFNVMKVPMGVDPEFHLDTLIDVFCRAYGLGIRSVTILLDVMKTLFEKEGVFDTKDPKEVTERSSRVTLSDAWHFLVQKRDNKEFGRDKSDAVDKIIDRLSRFGWEGGVLNQLYCQSDGMSIDEILGKDDVVVLESGKIGSNNMAFVFGFITASIYMYGKYLKNYFLGEDQYETCLVIEEANRVLTGTTDGGSTGGIQGQSIFEEILDQAAGMGLFVFSITQQPALMPQSIIANSGLIFAGKLTQELDINVIMTAVGREGRYDDRTLKKFFSKMPIGWFVAKNSRGFDFKESESVLISVDPLDVSTPTDDELIRQMEIQKLKKESQSIYEALK